MRPPEHRGLATFGVIARPWNLPEFIWAITGSILLVAFDLLPFANAVRKCCGCW
jgi:arsenical pump membrane protein